jgi:hypothetical protein
MSTAVEEVLSAWREAERLLESLPPVDPDHETVKMTVARLRDTYQTMAALGPETPRTVVATADTVVEARDLFAAIRAKRMGDAGTA